MSTVVSKNVQIGADGTASNNFTAYQPAAPDGTLRIGNGNSGSVTDAITLTSAGNLGLGVTPSAWNTFTASLQIDGASLSGLGANNTALGSNAYYSSGWKYYGTGSASLYQQNAGQHTWSVAPSGTAGNAISFTQAIKLDASGNLGIGTSSPTSKLSISGASAILFRSDNATAQDSERADFAFFTNSTTNNALRIGSLTSSAGVTLQGTAQNASVTKVNLVLNPDGGNVGIGTTSPNANSKLTLRDGTAASLYFGSDGAGGDQAYIALQKSADGLTFGVENRGFVWKTGSATVLSGTERMRIDSSGNVGIGTSSPAAKISVQNDSDTDYNPSISAFNLIASLKNSTSGALNNALLAFITESNGEWYIGGVQNSGNTNADFVFASRDGGARAERMRIDSSGNLLVGATGTVSSERLNVTRGGSSLRIAHFENTRNLAGDENLRTQLGTNCFATTSYHLICSTAGIGDVLYLYGNGNIQNYNNSYGGFSDVKLKQNIVDATPKLDDLMQVRVRNYNLIGSDKKQIGNKQLLNH
jgi:hypothetical protein